MQALQLSQFNKVLAEFGDAAQGVCLANVEQAYKLDDVMIYPWRDGIMHCLPIP